MDSFHPSDGHSQSDDTIDPNVRLYNPYKDLKYQNMYQYQLPTTPEYLYQEESIRHGRSIGENLTFYTGCAYLAGSVIGAGKGFFDGVKASEPGDTLKLRINRILNGSGQAGRSFGNRAGVIGLMYAALESGVGSVRATDDVLNSVVAGLGTGALYKAAAGPRSAVVAGAIGGLAAGLAVAGKQVAKRYVPI